jgi:hypothetical protein
MKSGYITEFNTFISNLEKKSSGYTKEDWSKAEKTFQKLSVNDFKKYEESFTPEERSKVNAMKGKYYALYAKSQINNLGKEFKDAIEQIEGGLKVLEKN